MYVFVHFLFARRPPPPENDAAVAMDFHITGSTGADGHGNVPGTN